MITAFRVSWTPHSWKKRSPRLPTRQTSSLALNATPDEKMTLRTAAVNLQFITKYILRSYSACIRSARVTVNQKPAGASRRWFFPKNCGSPTTRWLMLGKKNFFFFFSLERKTVCLLCYEKRQVAPSLISGALSLRQDRVTGQERASFLQHTRASPPSSETVTYRHFLPTTH